MFLFLYRLLFFASMERKKILAVNDERFWLGWIGLMLEDHDVQVDYASDGIEAVDKCTKKVAYDAILMNIDMPEMNGIEATKYLCKKGYGGRIVAWTAHCPELWTDRCLKEGMDGFYLLDDIDGIISCV